MEPSYKDSSRDAIYVFKQLLCHMFGRTFCRLVPRQFVSSIAFKMEFVVSSGVKTWFLSLV